MPKGNPLFQLIKNLSNREIKAVREHLSGQEGERSKDLQQLFELIINNRNFITNEEGVSSMNTDELTRFLDLRIALNREHDNFIKNIPYWKSKLYEIVLKSLRGLSDDSLNPQIRIHHYKVNGLLLWERGLEKLARAEFRKGQRLALNYDWNSYLAIGMMLRTLMQEFEAKQSKIDGIKQKCKEGSEQLNKALAFYDIYEEAYLALRDSLPNKTKIIQNIPYKISTQLAIKETAENIDKLLLRSDEKTKNFSLDTAFHVLYVMSLYHRMNKNMDIAIGYLQKLTHIFEKNKIAQKVYQSRYLNLLNNLLNLQSRKQQIDAMEATIGKLQKIAPIGKSLRIKKVQHEYYYLMLLYIVKKDYKKISLLSRDIKSYWDRHHLSLPLSRRFVFCINLSIAHLIEKENDSAHFWARKILDNKTYKVRPDIRVIAKIIELLLYFEEGNSYMIQVFAPRLKQLLRPQLDKYKSELKIVQTIIQASKEKDKTHIPTHFLHLKTNLQQEGTFFEEIIDWIDNRFS